MLNNYKVFQSNVIGDVTISHNQPTLVLNMATAQGYTLRQAGTPAWFLDQDYGLFYAGSYSQNALGQNEKWFKGNATALPGIANSKGNPNGNVWYYILPTGGVYAWNGLGKPLSGTLLSTLDPIYYYNPTMLVDALQENYAYDIKSTLGLFNPGNFYQNYLGMQERWIQGAGQLWYYITPSGKLYNASSTFLASLDPIYYNEPARLYAAQPLQMGPNLSSANPGATITQPTTGNQSGVMTITPTPGYVGKWIIELTTVNSGLSFTVERFTVSVVNAQPTFAPAVSSPQTLSHAAATSLTLNLTGADSDNDPLSYNASAGTQGYVLQTLYNLHSNGNYSTNYLGLNEKWVQGYTNAYNNPWYFLLPSGQFYAWNGAKTGAAAMKDPLNGNNPMVPLATLEQPSLYWINPVLLYQNSANNDLNYALKNDLGLKVSGSLSTTYLNRGDSWLKSSSGAWYYIQANGQMYLWGGTTDKAKDTLVATLAVLPTDTTSDTIALRIVNAQPGQFAGALQVTGNALKVTPASTFYGDIWVVAGVTDDAANTTSPGNNRFTYQSFKIKVIA